MAPLILAVDQGTTNTKALLVNCTGAPVFRHSVSMALLTPQPGFVEQDPNALWKSARAVMQVASEHAKAMGFSIEAIAISNQRETSVAWHRGTGAPLGPAVSWQCRRSTSICDGLATHAGAIRERSGLPLDPVHSASKWAWLLQNIPEVAQAAAEGQLCLGTVDSWLAFKLTGGNAHTTDHTNASRTGLLDLESLSWHPELLTKFGIPVEALPTLQPSSCVGAPCTAIPELAGVPIASLIGDSHAALAGHGAFRPGTIKATYGTGSSLMTLTPSLTGDTPQLARTVAWSTREGVQHALEGNIFMTGSALQWVGEFLRLPDPTAGALALAETVPDAAGAYLVPAMAGLAAPHWDATARGVLTGLTRSHTVAHMARAALESIAFQVADVFFAMQRTAGISLPALRADGGATRNSKLMQLQADLLGVPVLRSQNEELSALGAAHLAGLAINWWPTLETISQLPHEAEAIAPSAHTAIAGDLYHGWHAALRRALTQEAA